MTQIRLCDTSTDVRGGGYGSGAWIAKITGADPKFGLKREFCKKNTRGLSGSGRSGSISFQVTDPGIYEFRGFCVGSTPKNWEWSGFVILADGEEPREIARQDVLSELAKMAGVSEGK